MEQVKSTISLKPGKSQFALGIHFEDSTKFHPSIIPLVDFGKRAFGHDFT
jgi:hypothetical protein